MGVPKSLVRKKSKEDDQSLAELNSKCHLVQTDTFNELNYSKQGELVHFDYDL